MPMSFGPALIPAVALKRACMIESWGVQICLAISCHVGARDMLQACIGIYAEHICLSCVSSLIDVIL